MSIKAKLEKRAGLIKEARDLLGRAEKDKRQPTAEENGQFDKLMAEADGIKADVDREERLEKEEAGLKASRGASAGLTDSDPPKAEPKVIELRKSVCGDERRVIVPVSEAAAKLSAPFSRYLQTGVVGAELRALQKDVDTSGGYLSPPIEWQAELIRSVDNQTHMRAISRVLPPLLSAESLGAPSLDTDVADPVWTTELAIGTEDSSMAFGKRELTPHPLAKYIKVSKKLLRNSAISADAIVRERLAYKCAVVEENAFLNGTGAGQPLGVMTASAQGISTGRDVSTGNTTTEIRFDGLIEADMSLKAQYRRNVTWLFHRDAVKQIRKLKDGEGRYIWQASVVAGAPDTILTHPVRESEYMPNTFTTGLYVGILGDFSNYWIVDALTATIQVLVELYAAANQNGYIIRLEADGMPVLEEAFARVKLA